MVTIKLFRNTKCSLSNRFFSPSLTVYPKNQGPPGTLDSALPVKCKKLMILLIIIDLFSCYVHEMRRINAFIETHQHSELHKSLMGLLQISTVILFVLFLETSSQFNNRFFGNNWEMGSNRYWWFLTLFSQPMIKKWYFVTKIVLTYCEKKLF